MDFWFLLKIKLKEQYKLIMKDRELDKLSFQHILSWLIDKIILIIIYKFSKYHIFFIKALNNK
jgi:hypothetical protein